MATTLRLSPSLQARVDSYAKSLGVSVSSLVAIALVDYLDARSVASVEPPEPPPVDPRAAEVVREGFKRFEALSAAERVQENARLARLKGKR